MDVVINKSDSRDFAITRMITDRTGLHPVLSPVLTTSLKVISWPYFKRHTAILNLYPHASCFTLQVGQPYSVDVFLAERFYCDSVFLYQSSGVQLVRQWESTLPVDYLVDVTESLHTGGLVQAFHVADAFSSGPYTVEILSGNGQRRFEVKDASYSVPAAPATPAPPSVVLDGETVYLCPNVTNHTVEPIPTVAPGTPDTIWIDRERGGGGREGGSTMGRGRGVILIFICHQLFCGISTLGVRACHSSSRYLRIQYALTGKGGETRGRRGIALVFISELPIVENGTPGYNNN